ncbi:putative sushi domain protein, partial [Trichinella spiralis]|uniref:putative sushi domain protein n=1 Tax=Trichinella spiralis TaxID=6334 RepID=UPI0001EFC965
MLYKLEKLTDVLKKIYPEGFVAFSYPEYVQPPYSFPNPLWPLQHDPSFIAAFLSDQSFVHVGETQISHVWYRIVTRPQYRWKLATLDAQERAGLLSQPGRVEDPALLDAITRDIRENMVGTIGYTADYALIVTWERMGYGGQPKYLKLNEYDQIKKWISMVKARCIVPFNMIFKTGPVAIQIAQDGRSYSWYSSLYIHPPALTRTEVRLLSHTDKIDPSTHRNYWHLSDIENLTITWTAANISSKAGSRVDIVLWGYREDVIDREFLEVGAIARNIENTGKFSFNQKMLSKSLIVGNLWRKFWGGAIQIRLSKDDQTDYGKYVMWSGAVPFGWYFRDTWKANLGENWALKLCIEWYNYDGLRDNFLRNVYTNIPCPCTLSQALNDFGRFTPLPTCEMMGDSSCIYTKGAQHCIVSTNSMPDSGTEMCCYDYNGWLMFSQDYEQSTDYLRYFSAGVPYRANPWGGYVFKKPLYVPTWSNFYNDLLPYD